MNHYKFGLIRQNISLRALSVGALVIFLCGCFNTAGRSETTSQVIIQKEYVKRQPPGVVEYVWEEPMVDVIQVPPGLDPEGIYYRPSHDQVVEVRQGRWQYYGDVEKRAKARPNPGENDLKLAPATQLPLENHEGQ